MGVVVRTKNGKSYIFINHHGRRKAKMIGDRKIADLVASKIQAQLALGDFQFEKPPTPPTFKETAERWLERYVKTQCSQSTFVNYRRELKTWAFPKIGAKPLSEINRDDIKQIINDVSAKGLAKSTIKGVLAPISGIFDDAIDSGHKLVNPAARMKRLLKNKTDRRLRVNPLASEEVQRLLDGAAEDDHSRAESRYRDIFPSGGLFLLSAVRTGLRLGEILGLQWGDIDFHGRFIEVRRQWTRWGHVTSTKGKKLRRVDLSDQLYAAFQQGMSLRQADLALAGCDFEPDEPIFRNSAGRRLDHRRASRTIFKRCLLMAGLRQVRFHDLRHTFASLLITNGESLVYVKEQLGHHSIRETVDTYGHLIPGANRAAVNRLDPQNWRSPAATIRNPRATARPMPTHDLTVSPEKQSVGGGVWGSNPPTRY